MWQGTCACTVAAIELTLHVHPQDAQREMDDAEEYLAKVEKQYANKRL